MSEPRLPSEEQRDVVYPADMCKKHQWLLVTQARYRESDPWRALVVAAQITLFQAATCDPKTHERIGDDIRKIGSLGCLACYEPDAFGEIVEAAKSRELGKIKALGERWVEAARKPEVSDDPK